MNKNFLLGFLTASLVFLAGIGIWRLVETGYFLQFKLLSPVSRVLEKPLDKYAFERLSKRVPVASEVTFVRLLKKNAASKVWLFKFVTSGRTISGAATIPNGLAVSTESAQLKSAVFDPIESGKQPVIVMIHGFVDEKTYYSGFGTEHVAEVLAQNGYVTFAPDFAGLGESDKGPADSFEDRFQTYSTVLDLIVSICPTGKCKMGIWGHSNGGQIALSVLTLSGTKVPTVLWNPVSKFFPYGVLYYTDQFEDRGKWLRGALAEFERNYDVDKYSFTTYLPWIKAPIFLQQGELDREVPQWWSDELIDNLKKEATDSAVTYKVYPGADHNLQPGWNQAVADLLQFFGKRL